MKQHHLQFGSRAEEPSRRHVTKMEHGGSVPVSSYVPGIVTIMGRDATGKQRPLNTTSFL